MTNKLKRRRLTRLPSTHNEPGSSDKGKGNSRSTDSTSNFADVYPNLLGDATRAKQYARDILERQHSTIDIRPDGSILLVPYPRRQQHQLPNEIIAIILSYLPSHDNQSKQYRIKTVFGYILVSRQYRMKTLFACTLVSKQFHAVANPLLWQSIIYINNVNILERFIHCLCDVSPEQQLLRQAKGLAIRRLDIQGTFWTDAHLMRLLPHLSNLEHLTIISRQITYKSFRHLPQQCQQLKSIHLERTRLTPRSLEPIGKYCRQLTHLTWRLSKIQNLRWLSAFISCELDHLELSTTDRHLNSDIIDILQSWQGLTSLVVNIPQFPRHLFMGYMPSSLAMLSGNRSTEPSRLWPQLTVLKLSACYEVDDATLIPFIQAHPHLCNIQLGLAHRLTDASLATMTAQWLPHLRHLTISGSKTISSEGLRRFIRDSSPHLTTVDFGNCERIRQYQFPGATRKKQGAFGTTISLKQAAIANIKRTMANQRLTNQQH